MEFALKLLLSPLIKLIKFIITYGKKELEKDYRYFKYLKRLKFLSPKLEDNFKSIYLHTIAEYEQLKGGDYAKLFFQKEAESAFSEYYNKKIDWAFTIAIDSILHTNPKLQSLKDKNVNIKSEIDLFIRIFDETKHNASPQSARTLNDGINELKSGIKALDKNKAIKEKEAITDCNYFLSEIERPTDYLTRKIIHSSELKKDDLFYKKEVLYIKEGILKENRLVLLASGGIGKSTELKQLAFSCEDIGLIPIFISLKLYVNKEIEKCLPNKWENVPKEKLLIIFDGLDEINTADFLTTLKRIISFSKDVSNKDCKIVISCRSNFYDLPIEGFTDTLENNFSAYYLTELNVYSEEVRNYLKSIFKIKPEEFIKDLSDNGYLDLAENPFYLKSIAKIYSGKGSISNDRAQLFEEFVTSNIKFDSEKYKLKVEDIQHKKTFILNLLKRIALGMEISAKNEITEENLFKLIDYENEFELLKCCSLFEKKKGSLDTWQFEHRLIQEYLAAKALSSISFEIIIKTITFEKEHKKLIPSWVNTLAFLFSIIDKGSPLYSQLLDWLVKNEKEVIVKFEKDKIDEATRVDLFKEIFNFYKLNDIWISSNKFTDKDFARFGQADACLEFLLNEIVTVGNSRTVKLNAIRVLEHFEIGDKQQKIKEILLTLIVEVQQDSYYVYEILGTLDGLNIHDEDTLNRLMLFFEKRNNQYIRSGLYSIIEKAEAADKYIEYLINGLKIIGKDALEDREKVTLFGEDIHLFNCLERVKSAGSVKKIIHYFKGSSYFNYSYDRDKKLHSLINTFIEIFKEEDSIFDEMLLWFIDKNRSLENELSKALFSFFEKTNTEERGFLTLLKNFDVKDYNTGVALAKFANEERIQKVVEKYISRNITNDDVQRYYYDLRGFRNDNLFEKYEQLLLEKSGFVIPKPKQIDYEGIRKKRLQEDFNLLFDGERLKKTTLEIFDKEGKEELTKEELFEARKSRFTYEDWEDCYLETPLEILRDLTNVGGKVDRNRANIWFEDIEGVAWYCLTGIYQYLITDNNSIIVSSEQEKFITDWTKKEALNYDFIKEGVLVNQSGNVSYTYKAIFISFFTIKFKIEQPKEVLVNMLCLDYFSEENEKRVTIEYVSERVEKKVVSAKIISNIKEGLVDHYVMVNHFKYAVKNNLSEVFEIIKNEIVNETKDNYRRNAILDIYYEGTKDVQGIKELYYRADLFIKWEIIELLIKAKELEITAQHLKELLSSCEEVNDKLRAAELLISISDKAGLDFLLRWLKESEAINIPTRNKFNLGKMNSVELVPQLLELLELSYKRKIQIDNFYELKGVVLDVLSAIGISSEENFKLIKNKLELFINFNKGKLEHVNFIFFTIQQMETNFYMNKAQTYSIEQVVEKLKQLN